MNFQGKYFSCYKPTESYCLIAFTSWDIEQYEPCNHQFPIRWLDKINFESNLGFLNMAKKSGQKFRYFKNKKGEMKRIFYHF